MVLNLVVILKLLKDLCTKMASVYLRIYLLNIFVSTSSEYIQKTNSSFCRWKGEHLNDMSLLHKQWNVQKCSWYVLNYITNRNASAPEQYN